MTTKSLALSLMLTLAGGALFANATPPEFMNIKGSKIADTIPSDTTIRTDTSIIKRDTTSFIGKVNGNLTAFNFSNVRDTVPADTTPKKKDTTLALNNPGINLTAFNFSVVKDTIPSDTTPKKKDSAFALNNANMNLTAFNFSMVKDTIPSDTTPKKERHNACIK